MRRRVIMLLVLVAIVAMCGGCTSKAAGVRRALATGYGAPFSTWSDGRINRFGEEVCTQLDPNLAPPNPAHPPRWIHFYSPGILRLFYNAYCS
jgi:hypothetical protein